MGDLLQYLPLLNLLVLPVFAEYVRMRERMLRFEIHKERVERHLGFDSERHA